MADDYPYKDPSFYDLAEEQLLWIARLHPALMVVKGPRDTVVELERESQTLGERDYSLPPKMANVELVLRHHEARRVELIQSYQAAVREHSGDRGGRALARLASVAIG